VSVSLLEKLLAIPAGPSAVPIPPGPGPGTALSTPPASPSALPAWPPAVPALPALLVAPTRPPAPPAPPPPPGSLLARLTALGASLPPTPEPPVDIRQMALSRMAENDNQIPDLRSLALEKMGTAGQLTPGTPLTLPEEAPRFFGGIEQAGPKPRKPRAKVELVKPDLPSVSTDDLLRQMGVDPFAFSKKSRFADARRRAGVEKSPEFDRIFALPRRVFKESEVPDQTEVYRKSGGTMTLWAIQSASLIEAAAQDGLLGCIRAGGGKSLTALLLPVAMRSKRSVLLVPPQLKRKCLEDDIQSLYAHWQIPTAIIRVIAYSELSNATCSRLLDEINPDLIIADECHNLRHKTAARTKRFLRFMKEHPNCRFVGLSGTITNRSILDYQHLAELALRKNSPIPAHWGVLMEWAEALDVPPTNGEPAAPGALLKFCTDEEVASIANKTVLEAQPIVRSGFRRRLTETPGVISTEEGAVGTSLIISALRPDLPAEVKVALDYLRRKWEIDGEELIDAMSVARIARELAAGFYYRWVWPGGIKDTEWLFARSEWNKELREILKLNRRGLDSPLEVINAIKAGKLRSEKWDAWDRVRERPEPPREAVWLSDYLVDEAITWARETCSKANPGIIWYSWDTFGQRVALKGGFPWYGPGMKNDPGLAVPSKEPIIVCSVAAHGTGKNLQRYSRNLFTAPMSSGSVWEQALARTHRPGQEADEVAVDVFLHTEELQRSFDQATKDAHYMEESHGQKQKLLYAERLGVDFVEGMRCY
jgi:hypothetical protein